MEKSRDAFRTISEVAEWLDVPTHVLRFWESRFSQIKPVKRAGGRRYYRPSDMRVIGGVKTLLHDQGMTIRAVQKLFREEGIKHVSSFSPELFDPSSVENNDGQEVIEAEAVSEPASAAIFTHTATPISPALSPVAEPEPVPEDETQDELFTEKVELSIPATPDVPDTDPEDDAHLPGAANSVGFRILTANASSIVARRAEFEVAAKKLAAIRDRMN